MIKDICGIQVLANKWRKTGQYLDYKNCFCKNKLLGRLIKECTSIINETMINKKDNITNDNTYLILFIVGIVILIKKIKRFYLSESRKFDLLNYKNGYKVIRNKKQN